MAIPDTRLQNVPVIIRCFNSDGVIISVKQDVYPEFTDNYLEDLILVSILEDSSVVRVTFDIALQP